MASAPKTRPGFTDGSPEIWEPILAGLRLGETLTSLTTHKPDGPLRTTFHEWRKRHPELDKAYHAAKAEGFDAIADECQRIADDCPADRDWVAKAKLQIDTRMKLLAKWDPKRYGEKAQVALTGAEGGPLEIRWARNRGEAVQDPSDKAPDA